MSDVPPPEQPGWYADADGAWWWWDGSGWTPAPAAAAAPPWSAAGAPDPVAAERSQERTTAVIMWVVYLIAGGWISSLVFYFTARQKPFLRHHAAESLNLAIWLLVPQVVALALMVPAYVGWVGDLLDDPEAQPSFPGTFWGGMALIAVTSVVNILVGILGAVRASGGRWWRIPLPAHPVRGVVAEGEEPYPVA